METSIRIAGSACDNTKCTKKGTMMGECQECEEKVFCKDPRVSIHLEYLDEDDDTERDYEGYYHQHCFLKVIMRRIEWKGQPSVDKHAFLAGLIQGAKFKKRYDKEKCNSKRS